MAILRSISGDLPIETLGRKEETDRNFKKLGLHGRLACNLSMLPDGGSASLMALPNEPVCVFLGSKIKPIIFHSTFLIDKEQRPKYMSTKCLLLVQVLRVQDKENTSMSLYPPPFFLLPVAIIGHW